MDETAKLQRFFTACEELISGKFILADTKIGELLRSVATSEELTRLFAAVTAGFDYPAAKASYLRDADSLMGTRGEAYLPSERKDILAFVFCLLVDFDNGAMKFNDFLLRYFYEDGSYTASYALFVGRMIRPFRDIVRSCFPNLGKTATVRAARSDNLLDRLSERIALERTRIALERTRIAGLGNISPEDIVAGDMMLSELQTAAARGFLSEIKALLCGYLYFLQALGIPDKNSDELFALASEL